MLRHFTSGLLAIVAVIASMPASAYERSAHVADINRCFNLLSNARDAYINGENIKAYIQNTYSYDKDGHVDHPYVYILLLPERLSELKVDDFIARSEYLVHPFFSLGPVGHLVYEKESSPHKSFALDLENAKSRNDGNMWTVAYSFHTKKSKNSQSAFFEDDHKKDFMRLLIDGRKDLTGRRLIASCGYAETGILGPTTVE